MKNFKRLFFVNILIILCLNIVLTKNIYASNIFNSTTPLDYAEEFKEYLKLTEYERKKLIQPRMFNMGKDFIKDEKIKSLENNIDRKFSLKDVISNIEVKDQGKANTCWAFAAISSLETNLALNTNKSKVYDFSERHMNYATIKNFKNNIINDKGFNRTPDAMGSFEIALAYLTNGSGAVNENEMPYNDDLSLIEISEIQNKNISSQVYDTTTLPSVESIDDLNNIKLIMKDHIKKYGSISTSVYGAELINDYYNNTNAAMYCDNKQNCPINHAVSIIGWDDDFSIENFNEQHRPKNNGAWLVKNSWGAVHKEDLKDWKEKIYEILKSKYSTSELESRGITDHTKLPDEFIKQIFKDLGFEVEIKNDKIYINVGKDGYMYISYEDVNIYTSMLAITKAVDYIDYENLYQYNNCMYSIGMVTPESKVYLANVFNKKSTNDEYLHQVSLNVAETYTCKVYVNPNNSSIKKEDLKPVKLVDGESKTIDAGFHTLEFDESVKITGDEFVVVIEVGSKENKIITLLETKIPNTFYDTVEIESGKCFFTDEEGFAQSSWGDLSKASTYNASLKDGDSTIKAYTSSTPIKKKIEQETASEPQSDQKTEEKISPNPTQNPSEETKTNTQIPAKEDKTLSKNILPNTGVKSILIFIVLLIVYGIYMRVRYRKIQRYVK